jgi:transporter family protein
MNSWLAYALIAIVLWGIVGLLQKLGTNKVSAGELMVWLMIGFAVLLPFLLLQTRITALSLRTIFIGLAGGLANGLGSWELFRCLEKGAKASVAIPLTALYPLLTAMLAILLLKERLTPLEWVGVAVALIAGGLLSYEPSQGGSGDSHHASVMLDPEEAQNNQ